MAVETYDELYAMAREEGWTMDNCLPVTVGWLHGYYDQHFIGTDYLTPAYPPYSMAWIDYCTGIKTAKAEIAIEAKMSRMFGCWDDPTTDYHDGSGTYSTGVLR